LHFAVWPMESVFLPPVQTNNSGDKQKFLNSLRQNLDRQATRSHAPAGGNRVGTPAPWRGSHNEAGLPHLLGSSAGATKPQPMGAMTLPPLRSSQSTAKPPSKPTSGSQSTIGSTKGSISMLQEFVQCSKSFHIPSNYPILQWSFETQMADSATLKFRAIVAFLLEGVPHHVAGAWQQSKKHAQRDAAERALSLYVGQWGSQIFQADRDGADTNSGQLDIAPCNEEEEDEARLTAFCKRSSVCGNTAPKWSIVQEDDGQCRATVELSLLGVTHKLGGTEKPSERDARADAARRVLWYVQCPGYEEAFEPEPIRPSAASVKIAQPPEIHWCRSGEELADEAIEVAERKTAVMRVQNRLQQKFSQQLRPGQSVWEWSYETDPSIDEWPPAYKAAVQIPVLGRRFEGKWARGQREAQLDTIQQVTEHLDALERC